VAGQGSWRVMPRPALSRPLTWSSVGTNSLVRCRLEASQPMRATSSREGRRAEAGSEGIACASVAGWGGAAGCRSAPPRPGWFPAPATFGAPAAATGAHGPQAVHFVSRRGTGCVIVAPTASPRSGPGRPPDFLGVPSQPRVAGSPFVTVPARCHLLKPGPDGSLSPHALFGASVVGIPCPAELAARRAT
jgi:hypothetical protein